MRVSIKKFVISASNFIKYKILRRYVSHLLKERGEIFLEIGAGSKKGKNGWVTVDMAKDCDIYWDLRNGIPFPDQCISKIYSSHFLEHLSFKEGQKFLDECLRVLLPGGKFSICVPDARIYIESYLMNKDLDAYLAYKPAHNHTTKIDYVNYMAYMDGHHKYMFDKENLIHILKSKGFKNVNLREFDSNVDLKERDFQSIYAEAEK
jgi:predicted SAM-dependent methyltransferase